MRKSRFLDSMDTRVLCAHCGKRGDQHRCSDGACPPDRAFPALTRVKDPDAAIARYWGAGPGTFWRPRR